MYVLSDFRRQTFFPVLLLRIHHISGFHLLLGESPIHNLIFLPELSIPSSPIGLGDERRVRLVA